jgi:hypothetical protein
MDVAAIDDEVVRQVGVEDFESGPERDEIVDDDARRRHELDPDEAVVVGPGAVTTAGDASGSLGLTILGIRSALHALTSAGQGSTRVPGGGS